MSREYSRRFKEEAMKLVTEKGYPPTKAARELGIRTQSLFVWLKKSGWKAPAEEALGPPLPKDPELLQIRIRQLEAQVKRLEMEKDILKKATAYFASQNP